MTRDDVKRGLREVAQVTNFDEQYPNVIGDVRADAQLGQKLGVQSTPTFYINGIQLGTLRPTYFDATIRHALKKAGVTS
jgi:protein-disulfide isomerase